MLLANAITRTAETYFNKYINCLELSCSHQDHSIDFLMLTVFTVSLLLCNSREEYRSIALIRRNVIYFDRAVVNGPTSGGTTSYQWFTGVRPSRLWLLLGTCTCWFICQGTSTRRQQKDLFDLPSQAATCYYRSNHSRLEAIPLSALPKDTTSELASFTLFL